MRCTVARVRGNWCASGLGLIGGAHERALVALCGRDPGQLDLAFTLALLTPD
jgi:hypothetical protein